MPLKELAERHPFDLGAVEQAFGMGIEPHDIGQHLPVVAPCQVTPLSHQTQQVARIFETPLPH
ncbi:hypothetical protein D9M68_767550 [compost metagenome]